MSRTRIVKGKYDKIIGKDYNMYTNGNTNITALGKNSFKAGNTINYGSEVKSAPTYQPENSVNIYVGMFFDGTGNNRYNSDKIYYTELAKQGGKIKADSIPPSASFTNVNKANNKKEKIKYTDRDSYWNPYSNIAKLFDLYKEVKEEDSTKELGVHYILKQYVEGIGTKENKADDFKGSALARGQWGVISRVEEGIDKLVTEQFPKDLNGKKINKIVIDVFGFSRGAAAARHFCNEVSKKVEYELQVRSSLLNPMGTGEKIMTAPAGGRLGAKLKAAGFLPVGDTYKIELRFLGLFDTVVSDISSFLSITKPFIPEIKFDISNLNIKNILHIKAQHEWRKNFPFTPTGSRSTVGMLGSHSDIGGGYAELDLYNPILSFFDVPVGNTTILNDMENYQQFYLNNHISTKLDNKYDHYESIIRETHDTSKPGMTLIIKERRDSKYVPSKKPLSQQNHIIEEKISGHYVLEDNRYISNKLSLVPMYTMLQEAISSKVPFYEDYKKAIEARNRIPYPFEYELPDDPVFKQYLELMQDYVKNRKKTTQSKFFIPAAIYKHIMQKYVHLSAHYGGLSNDFITVKGGDHHLLGNIVFINQPVKPTVTNEVVSYERETYP